MDISLPDGRTTIQAIRRRNEKRRASESKNCDEHGERTQAASYLPGDGDACLSEEIADIDALLAEVERLRKWHVRVEKVAETPHGDAAFIATLPTPPDGWKIRPNTSESWLEVEDEFAQETVVIKWDGCVHLDVYYNMTEPDDSETPEKEQNHDYVHLCDIGRWSERLTRLVSYARSVGVYTE